jgi:hypothetical protein
MKSFVSDSAFLDLYEIRCDISNHVCLFEIRDWLSNLLLFNSLELKIMLKKVIDNQTVLDINQRQMSQNVIQIRLIWFAFSID